MRCGSAAAIVSTSETTSIELTPLSLVGRLLANVPLERGLAKIHSTLVDDRLQAFCSLFPVWIIGHVVFALMPHEPFNSILDALLIQFSQRGFNQIKCQRNILKPVGSSGFQSPPKWVPPAAHLMIAIGCLMFLEVFRAKLSSGPTLLLSG